MNWPISDMPSMLSTAEHVTVYGMAAVWLGGDCYSWRDLYLLDDFIFTNRRSFSDILVNKKFPGLINIK
jgi:hypothetical protein